ncbi:MAG: hypothetical protein M0T84_01830 [Betaproteobacteria bacterium]|nr:hypothetical protein [Betaproteobacteria bacterium]
MAVERWKEIARDALGRRHPVAARQTHLQEAMAWLCRAQDATGTGGVSRSYALRWMPSHHRRGWLAAYPETTGYIIPTFIAYARLTGDEAYRARALRMASWEADVQMDSGAVQGGVIDFPASPAIFNTGQVLFGWAAGYRETGEARFRDAAIRAADFLVSAQDADGAWRRHGSRYSRPGVNVYDARTAWGLLEAHRITGEARHRDAAVRNLEFALAQQKPSGWFAQCCLDDDERPLLHTLAYTMEGLLESGMILEESRYVDAATRAAEALLRRQRADGGLPGRFDAHWRPQARFSCLTGDAQTAIVWLRLHAITRDARYFEAARRLNDYVASTQDLVAENPGIRGGIKGSFPIWAEYGSYEYLNWAAKFFADAAMLELAACTGPGVQRTGDDVAMTGSRCYA